LCCNVFVQPTLLTPFHDETDESPNYYFTVLSSIMLDILTDILVLATDLASALTVTERALSQWRPQLAFYHATLASE